MGLLKKNANMFIQKAALQHYLQRPCPEVHHCTNSQCGRNSPQKPPAPVIHRLQMVGGAKTSSIQSPTCGTETER